MVSAWGIVHNGHPSDFFAHGVLGIIKLIKLQDIMTSDNAKKFFVWKPQHFIRRQHRAFSHAAGFPKFRCIVGDPPGTQLLGFAEANPSADIDGIDAQRKIIILSALASGILADGSDVYAETLRNITMADIDAADRMNAEIKLIAQAKIGDKLEAYVCPMIVPHTDPLSHISDVYNGISVTSPVSGDMMYYGRGAGRYPTAGAVMADAVAVLSGAASSEKIPVFEQGASTKILSKNSPKS